MITRIEYNRGFQDSLLGRPCNPPKNLLLADYYLDGFDGERFTKPESVTIKRSEKELYAMGARTR